MQCISTSSKVSVILQFVKKDDLDNLKSDVDELDADELKKLPCGWSSLKSKINKLDIGNLETNPTDSSRLNDLVKNEVV